MTLALLPAQGGCFQLLRRTLSLHVQPVLLPVSSWSIHPAPRELLPGQTHILMILMSFNQCLGVSVAVFSTFAVAVSIFQR